MPSTVSTSTNSMAVGSPCQRGEFYANGRFWVFYFDGSNMVYCTSTDGSSWSSATIVRAVEKNAHDFSVWFDEIYLHYTYSPHTEGGDLVYRRGIPNSNGTVTWSTVEQTAYDTPAEEQVWSPSIAVDTNGYPFITYLSHYSPSYDEGYPYVIKSSTNDGTWVTDTPTFPYQLHTIIEESWKVSVIPLTAGKMYTFCAYSYSHVFGRLWSNSSWGSVEDITAYDIDNGDKHSAVAEGDNIHLAYTEHAASNIELFYLKRTYGVGWGDEVLIYNAGIYKPFPVLSINTANSDLYCFWWEFILYHDSIYYKKMVDNVWDTNPTAWIDEGLESMAGVARISAYYQAYDNKIGVTYETKRRSPFNVKFAFLTTVAPLLNILTIETIGQGTTNPMPGGWEYPAGSEVMITAIPATGWVFDHWEGDISSIDNPVIFTIMADMTITAVFVQIPTHILTIYGPETIDQGTTSPTPGSHSYLEGTVISISAIPAAGWQFDYWAGDISSTDNPVSFTITQDMIITGIFSEIIVPPEEYAVTISVIGSGTTDPIVGAYTVTHDTAFTVTAYPSDGWRFSHWEGSISGIANPTTFTVFADMTIIAVFTEIVVPTHTLTISVIGQGTTNPVPGSWDYLEGTEVSVSAIPAAGWQFDYWEGDISTGDNPVSLLITQAFNITAVFSEVVVPPEEHAVTISVIGQGTTSPVPGAYTVIHGASLTITAYPVEGWLFSHWEGDISGTANPVDIEVLRNISVVAVFAEVPPPPPPKRNWLLPVGIIAGIVVGGIALVKGGKK